MPTDTPRMTWAEYLRQRGELEQNWDALLNTGGDPFYQLDELNAEYDWQDAPDAH